MLVEVRLAFTEAQLAEFQRLRSEFDELDEQADAGEIDAGDAQDAQAMIGYDMMDLLFHGITNAEALEREGTE